ncbi:MAG: type II toxin-antitoxin system RatA family toxin [Alphaproteobacteria bacterium]|nr:type II toxin-antitoxin system RatA family toxin [Alphaproteobacteria bacterium]
MPTFRNRRRLTFTPDQMFDLVADVEQYPQFVPLCETLRITERSANGHATILVATMGVGYHAIRESFTTRVSLNRQKYEILVEYLDGPFSHLENRWRFLHADNGGCDVDFLLDYEFRSRMLAMLMGTVFDKAFRKFSAAFEARAHRIYKSPSSALRTADRPA